MRLGILSSHPIQYLTPLYRELAGRCDLQVFYAYLPSPEQQGRQGFQISFRWDIDLLGGYTHHFLRNEARRPSTSRFNGCDTPEIAEQIRKSRFDAFLVSGWNLRSYWQAAFACQRNGTRLLVRGDSQLPIHADGLHGFVKERAKNLLYPRMLNVFDAFCSVGQRNRDYLLHYGITQDRIFFSPHAADEGVFSAPNRGEDIRAARIAFGVESSARVALFVGKFIPLKRIGDLVSALDLLARSGENICGVFVGTGPEEARLRCAAEKTSATIKFAGFRNQSQLPAVYAAADVIVLPSESETWGMVVSEAFLSGTPAIVSDAVGSGPDLINENTGAVYPVGDVPALAQAIQTLCRRGKTPAVRSALLAKSQTYSVKVAATGIMTAAINSAHAH